MTSGVYSDAKRVAYLDMVDRQIREHGWAVQVVGAAAGNPPYAYTVGLARARRPELLLAGPPACCAVHILNIAAGQHIAVQLRKGDTVRVEPDDVLDVVAVGLSRAEYLLSTAVALYGPQLHAVELVSRTRFWLLGHQGHVSRPPDTSTCSDPPPRRVEGEQITSAVPRHQLEVTC